MNTSKKDQNFRNFIPYPYNDAIKRGNQPPRKKQRYPWNASGYNMCCGLAASGDTEEPAPAPVVTAAKVHDMKTWQYAKTALMLVGLYAIGTYLYKKYKK